MPDTSPDQRTSDANPDRAALVESMNTAVSAMSDFARRLISYLGSVPLDSPDRFSDEMRVVQEAVVAPSQPPVAPDLALPVGATLHWLTSLAGPDMAAAQDALRSRMAQVQHARQAQAQVPQGHPNLEAGEVAR